MLAYVQYPQELLGLNNYIIIIELVVHENELPDINAELV